MFLFVRLLPVIPAFEMRRLFRELWLERAGSGSRWRIDRAATQPARPRLRGTGLYGVMAEFDTADAAAGGTRSARTPAAIAALDAYSPFPVEGLGEALGCAPTRFR